MHVCACVCVCEGEGVHVSVFVCVCGWGGGGVCESVQYLCCKITMALLQLTVLKKLSQNVLKSATD